MPVDSQLIVDPDITHRNTNWDEITYLWVEALGKGTSL